MERKFKEALAHRRSYYALSNKSLVSNEEIEEIVKFAVKNIPSAFNSQSTRVVLLLGDSTYETVEYRKRYVAGNSFRRGFQID